MNIHSHLLIVFTGCFDVWYFTLRLDNTGCGLTETFFFGPAIEIEEIFSTIFDESVAPIFEYFYFKKLFNIFIIGSIGHAVWEESGAKWTPVFRAMEILLCYRRIYLRQLFFAFSMESFDGWYLVHQLCNDGRGLA